MKKSKFSLPNKKLKRSKKEKLIAGVLGGIAEYFNIDPTVVRIIWLLCVAFTGFVPGIITYVAAALIIPQR